MPVMTGRFVGRTLVALILCTGLYGLAAPMAGAVEEDGPAMEISDGDIELAAAEFGVTSEVARTRLEFEASFLAVVRAVASRTRTPLSPRCANCFLTIWSRCGSCTPTTCATSRFTLDCCGHEARADGLPRRRGR